MWEAIGETGDPKRFEPFDPAEVLYEFDGPRVFTLRDSEGELNLAYWSDGDDVVDRYIVVPTTASLVGSLRTGSVTMYEALDQARCWACDLALDGRIASCLRVDFDVVPRDALPAPGTMLLPTLEPSIAVRARERVEVAVRHRADAPTLVDLEGRIGQFDWDRLSFDLRDVNGGRPDQGFVFDADLFDSVFRLAQAQVRVRVAGLAFPGKPIAYASALSRL